MISFMDKMNFLDESSRFLRPDFNNSSINAISTVMNKLDLISVPKFSLSDNESVKKLWNERGKQDKVQKMH